MNRNILYFLLSVGGLSSLGLREADLVDLPPWLAWVALACGLLALAWRRLPDLDGDGRPDLTQRFWGWFEKLMPWNVFLVLFVIGCSGAPIIEPVGVAGSADFNAVFELQDGTIVRLTALAGADYVVQEGADGFAEVCLAVGAVEFYCHKFVEECPRDPVTGLCVVPQPVEPVD